MHWYSVLPLICASSLGTAQSVSVPLRQVSLAFFQLRLVFETVIGRPYRYLDLEFGGIVVLKCHFCVLFSLVLAKFLPFQIFSYKYLESSCICWSFPHCHHVII